MVRACSQAKLRYGNMIFIVARAMIQRGEESDRIVLDGTHGVRVNHRIKTGTSTPRRWNETWRR